MVSQIQSYDILDNERYAGCFQLKYQMIKHRNTVLREKKNKAGPKSLLNPGFKDSEVEIT